MKKAIIISFLFGITVLAQTHFVPVEQTGESYHIVVTNATVNGSPICAGTEIAVFDDTLCVGASVFEGSYNLAIVAWEESPIAGLPGFVIGHPMIFKLWSKVDSNWIELGATPEYEEGDGTFGTGAYSVVSLTANVEDVERTTGLVKTKIDVYPNPAVNKLNISIDSNEKNVSEFTLGIYDMVGRMIYKFDLSHNKGNNFVWQGETLSGNFATSGVYLLRYVSGKNLIVKKFLFVK